MKPHEETWVAHASPFRNRYALVLPNPEGSAPGPTRAIAFFEGDGARERARLAAQAPAMARWMLAWIDAMDAMGTNDENSVFGREVRAMLRAAGVLP